MKAIRILLLTIALFSAGYSANAAMQCIQCEPGKYATYSGQCITCETGNYCVGGKKYSCPAGYDCSGTGNIFPKSSGGSGGSGDEDLSKYSIVESTINEWKFENNKKTQLRNDPRSPVVPGVYKAVVKFKQYQKNLFFRVYTPGLLRGTNEFSGSSSNITLGLTLVNNTYFKLESDGTLKCYIRTIDGFNGTTVGEEQAVLTCTDFFKVVSETPTNTQNLLVGLYKMKKP